MLEVELKIIFQIISRFAVGVVMKYFRLLSTRTVKILDIKSK